MSKIGEGHIDVDANMSKAEEQAKAGTLKIGAVLSKAFSGISGMINMAGIGMLAGISISLTAGTRAAVEFEDAFAMVKKTMADVDSPEVFEQIADDLKALATQIPVRASELAGLGSVAGQLGVSANDVSKFVEVTGKLGVATNMTGEQAATSLARFLNVTNNTTDSVGKFASILVQLGNNVAAQESEIILLAQNFGAIGTVAGLSATDILAFSAAMRETGQQASAGSTALGKLFTIMADAGKSGGGALFDFAQVAGVGVGEFAGLIEEDIAKAAQVFLKGLDEMNKSGQALTPTLQKLGLNQVRTARAVLSLANNQEGLNEALALAREEAITQNALNEEAATRFETVSQKVAQFKAITNVAASEIGEIFLPVISKLMDFFITLAKGLVGLVRGFKELSTGMKGLVTTGMIATILKMFKNMVGLFKEVAGSTGPIKKFFSGFGKIIPTLLKPLKLLTGAVGAVVMAISGLFKLGKKQENFDDFNSGIKGIADSLKELDTMEGGIAQNISDEVVKGFVEGLPEGFQAGVRKGISSGAIDEAVVLAAIEIGDVMGSNISDSLRNALEVGDVLDGNQLSQLSEAITAMDLDGGEKKFGIIFTTAKALQEELRKGANANKDSVEALEAQLALLLQIGLSSGELETQQEQLARLITEQVGAQVAMSPWFQKSMETEQGRLNMAMRFKDTNKEIFDLLVTMGKLNPVDPIVDAFSQLEKDTNNFLQILEDLTRPQDLMFDVEMAEFDVADAHKEHNDLHQESKDLHQEDIDLAQELADLQTAEIMTQEEKLEQQELLNEALEMENEHKKNAIMTLQEQKKQQDLINQALEIEERLRNNLALSANDQLQREKLRKDRRRVELAVQQGSLEFGDLELQAIDENIAAIEAKAVTQQDADIAREKAAGVIQKAEARRENEILQIEQMRADANEILLEAQARRNQEIETIEKRRIEINERLLELPREIKEAHIDIHDAQMDLIEANANVLLSFRDLRSVVVEDAIKMAEALGMPMSVLDGIMTLFNHAKVEAVPKINQRMKEIDPALASQLTGIEYSNARADARRQQFSLFSAAEFKNRHIGGAVKPSGSYMVGELGPEILKMNPSGGGFINRLNQGSNMGMSQNNTVNVNVTGLPTDPIASRRIAQNIQRELNKLSRDGRSGSVR
tara:strand:- start:253 stop:3714 length:3462 start_codon:yes stop_codon:yes gene_type:complete